MKIKTQTTAGATATAYDRIWKAPKEPTAAEQSVPVMSRFERAELDAMKKVTGANADATAVACFVRLNLRKRG